MLGRIERMRNPKDAATVAPFGGSAYLSLLEAIMSDKPLDEDRKLVVAYMHYQGKKEIHDKDFWEVYALADGFGRLPLEMLAEINGGYDWSHVRDSTPEGWERMANYLRQHGYTGKSTRENPSPVPRM